MWGAHKADGRIASNNAPKIRAALKQSIDANELWRGYSETHPIATDHPAQDKARARAWVMLHIQFENEPILKVLTKVWADGFVLGQASANEALAKSLKQGKKSAEITKAPSPAINWDTWKPGNASAALILKPTNAFQAILDGAQITIKGLNKSGIDSIGSALADSVALGYSSGRAAKLIQQVVSDPSRALSIAITEQSRAINMATVERYNQAGLEEMEWITSDPCDICAPNDGQVVRIGQAFNSGDEEPPAHPNCRCALLPVIPDFADMPNENGVVDILPSVSNNASVLADSIYANAKQAEAPATELMTSIAGKLNAELAGLKNRLKEPKSLAEKIGLLAVNEFDGNYALAAQSIKDALRYTMVVDSSRYASTVTNSLEILSSENYSVKVKNYWKDGSVYKGVNLQLVDPNGQMIELQFHTPESLKVKGIIHPLYESWRVLDPNTSEALMLQSEMTKTSATLSTPSGVQVLP